MRDVAVHKGLALERSASLDEEGFFALAWDAVMWNLTKAQTVSMRRDISRFSTEGDEAAAESWLVWAETYLNTLDVPGPPIPGVNKILPLVVWMSDAMDVSVNVIYDALRESLPGILWQSRLTGRDLNIDDGHTALRIIRSSLKEADG